MANYNIVAAEVVAGTASNPSFETLVAGEAIAQGEGYYLKAADGKAWRAINTSAAAATLRGVCVAGALAAGQKMVGQKTQTLTAGATAAIGVGAALYVSATAGKFCPEADLGTGAYVTVAGWGTGTNEVKLGINATGIAHA